MNREQNVRLRKKRKNPTVPRYYPLPVKGKFRRKGPPPIPKFAHWGFTYYHPSIKVLILSVFLAFVSLTTPFWAYVDDSTFGLWMYCSYSSCTSIHDNLVEGGSVPAWYHMTQGSFCIGTVASLVALGILVHNVYGKDLKMTSTVYTTALCVLGISVFQMTMALYTFSTYFEHTNFLYHVVSFEDQNIDYHGAFYCGLVSTILNAVAAIIILVDDSITKASKKTHVLMGMDRGEVDPSVLLARYEEYAKRWLPHRAFPPGDTNTFNESAQHGLFWKEEGCFGEHAPSTHADINHSVYGADSSLIRPYPDNPPPYEEANKASTKGCSDQAFYDGSVYYSGHVRNMWEAGYNPYDAIIEEEFVPLSQNPETQ